MYYFKAENKNVLECWFWDASANISSCNLSLIGSFIHGLSSGFWYFPSISIQIIKKKTCFTTEMSVWNNFGILSLMCTLSNVLFLFLVRNLYLATSHLPIFFCLFSLLFYHGKNVFSLLLARNLYLTTHIPVSSVLFHACYFGCNCFLLGAIQVVIQRKLCTLPNVFFLLLEEFISCY